MLGLTPSALEAACQAARPLPLTLPSGLTVWSCCRAAGTVSAAGGDLPDGDAAAAAVALPSPAAEQRAQTLQDAERTLVLQALQTCEGNVSRAARLLGVSRGLVYRHLRTAPPH